MDKQQQPVAIGIPVGQHNAPAVAADGEFSTDLCDCFSDVSLCCLTCWCPCIITFGRIAEIVDRGSTSCGMSGVLYTLLAFTGFQCIYSGLYRQKMKAQYGIPEECPADFCLNCWCEYCALCQGYRELQHRGYDVTLGWHGNMERQNKDYQGVATVVPPSMPGGMTR